MKCAANFLAVFILTGSIFIGQTIHAANCPDRTQPVPYNLDSEIERLENRGDQRACREMWITQLRTTLPAHQLVGVANAEILQSLVTAKKEAALEQESQKKFSDLGFGIGVGYSFGSGGDRIQDAEYVNDVLRVKADNTGQARVLLEAHWFFVKDDSNFGHGPFASVNTGGSDDAIGSFALGYMIGFRDRKVDSEASWNLGIGYIVDSDVQVLGDGLKANEARPEGETEVRFKRKSEGGIVVLFSRGF